ncbi:MAG: PilZ domain-containing protein [Syntrophales bacterium]
MLPERRKYDRHNNGVYMRVTDKDTEEIMGYLTEISLGGFKLESPKNLTVDKDYTLRLEYAIEEKDKRYIVFVARPRWSQPDPITPYEYILGFQIVSMAPSEQEIYRSIVENYGVSKSQW